MSEIKVNFDELPESKEFKSVSKAGVHLKFHIDEVEFSEAKEKDGKKIGESVRILLRSENSQFTIYKFSPPTKPEDVKYVGGFYQNGKEVRKKTPEEQIQADFAELYYMYEQLAKALGGGKDVIDKYKAAIRNAPLEATFKTMFDKFFTIFPVEKIKNKFINFKALWNNNDKNKTSFLSLSKASGSNMVFAAYVNDTSPILEVNGAYEEKCMVRKYSPLDRAPKTDATEISSETAEQWKPVGDDKELF